MKEKYWGLIIAILLRKGKMEIQRGLLQRKKKKAEEFSFSVLLLQQ